jgi:hypothetical protein
MVWRPLLASLSQQVYAPIFGSVLQLVLVTQLSWGLEPLEVVKSLQGLVLLVAFQL